MIPTTGMKLRKSSIAPMPAKFLLDSKAAQFLFLYKTGFMLCIDKSFCSRINGYQLENGFCR